MVCLASECGTVTVVKAGVGLEVLARNGSNKSITASPAAAGNELYVRSARQLWAFEEKRR